MVITSALTACACGLLLTALSINVSRLRIRHRVSFGSGNHKDLEVAVRAHGNALEQVMLFLLLLLIAELCKIPHALLGSVAVVFVAARLLHAWAIFARKLPVRQVAHIGTVLCQWVLMGAMLWFLH